MDLYKSSTYMENLDDTINSFDWMERFAGKSVLITGVTGLICSGIVDLLLRYNELHNTYIVVYAAARNRDKVRMRFSRYADSTELKYVQYDAVKKNTLDFDANYVIHGAGNAFPKLMQEHPIDTMKANFEGMSELLEYASSHPVIKTVYISSSEVYGRKNSLEPFREDEHGYIDVLNPRASYAVGKLASETLCASYAHEKKLAVSIVRPGHVYGPTANRGDNRISSAFAYDVLDGKDLVLKSDGSQLRSYCYVLDCATAILKVALDGRSSAAYNISNPLSVISIKEIAELFARCGKSQVKFEKANQTERAAFNPMQNSSLNSERLQALGWKGLFDAQRGTSATIQIMREACGKA